MSVSFLPSRSFTVASSRERDIVGAAPNLRHAAVHVQQGVHSHHAGAHGVLGGEDRITGQPRRTDQ